MPSNTACARPAMNHFIARSPGSGITTIIRQHPDCWNNPISRPKHHPCSNTAAGKSFGPNDHESRDAEKLRDKHPVKAVCISASGRQRDFVAS